ncbi:E2/UBC family protein [Erythrobacter colymbi]|uniref:E2/UBC family protein n=1 Tax=Erythrobacter colymbi TaxID=1161202 RepID=UPI000A3A4DBA|nr:E2/UBC family protein [Erythrobacter colymbi]
MRRQFDLLPEDEQLLNDYGLPWETVVDGSHWVLIHDFPTHEGYNHKTVTAAIRLETGYPITPLDMVYFHPALARIDGRAIGATQAVQQIVGITYQRWSRHRTAQNPWKPTIDSLGTHIVLIEDWLQREFEK